MPTKNASAVENATTEKSRWASLSRGIYGENILLTTSTMTADSKRPTEVPSNAKIRLSMSSCPIKSARRAPSAARTAKSLMRPNDRVSSRFDTLPQVMSKTNSTAPATISKRGLASPSIWVSKGTSLKFRPALPTRVLLDHSAIDPRQIGHSLLARDFGTGSGDQRQL